MTEKIGPYDFNQLHVAPDMTLYERRLQLVVTTSTGRPYRIIPEGVGYQSWNRFKSDPTDRIVKAWVLIPVITS